MAEYGNKGLEDKEYRERVFQAIDYGDRVQHEGDATRYFKEHPKALDMLVRKPKPKKKKEPSGNPKPNLPKQFERFLTDEEWWQTPEYKKMVENSTKGKI